MKITSQEAKKLAPIIRRACTPYMRELIEIAKEEQRKRMNILQIIRYARSQAFDMRRVDDIKRRMDAAIEGALLKTRQEDDEVETQLYR